MKKTINALDMRPSHNEMSLKYREKAMCKKCQRVTCVLIIICIVVIGLLGLFIRYPERLRVSVVATTYEDGTRHQLNVESISCKIGGDIDPNHVVIVFDTYEEFSLDRAEEDYGCYYGESGADYFRTEPLLILIKMDDVFSYVFAVELEYGKDYGGTPFIYLNYRWSCVWEWI